LRDHQRQSPEDQGTFDKWLKANAIFGALLFIGMLVMAWMGSNSIERTDAAKANNGHPSSSPIAKIVRD
jgi:threonine/homoserine/homoserine lactone efflux protein